MKGLLFTITMFILPEDWVLDMGIFFRIQSRNGFLLRINFTPFIANLKYNSTAYIFYPSFGLSLGYTFGKENN